MKDHMTMMKDMRFGPYGLLSKRKNILLSTILIVLTLLINPYIILIDAGIQASVPARTWDDQDDGPREFISVALGAPDDLKREANEWSVTRGSRSGRVAWQFIQDLAGRRAKVLDAS